MVRSRKAKKTTGKPTKVQSGGLVEYMHSEVKPVTDFTIMQIPIIAAGSPGEAAEQLTSALRECAQAVMDAHEHIKNNRPEIDRLREETRALISEMKAA